MHIIYDCIVYVSLLDIPNDVFKLRVLNEIKDSSFFSSPFPSDFLQPNATFEHGGTVFTDRANNFCSLITKGL
jgi:hypothetical protein